MKEQEKEAVKKAQARRETARNEYLNRLLASQQRLHSFLMEKMQTVETEMSLPADQIVEASSLAVAAYEKSSIILPDKSI